MKTFAAIARREFQEKRFVVWAALGAALVPLALPALLQLRGGRAQEVRDMCAVLLSLGISAAIAAGMGSSIFAGELAARRTSFFFSRPISAFSLWAGKLAAALLLTLGAFALMLGPVLAVDGPGVVLRELPVPLVVVTLGLVPLVLVAACGATMVRSRSKVAIADLFAAAATALLWVWIITALGREMFHWHYWMLWMLGGLLTAALGFATYRAVARGRTDITAAHAASSGALWIALAAPAASLGLFLVWATSAPVTAMSKLHWASATGSTSWITAMGPARGLEATYLFDPLSGRFHRLPRETYPAITADGKSAVWFQSDQQNGSQTLHRLRLEDPKARSIETKFFLRFPTGWQLIVFDDGTRVGALSGGLLSVYDVPSGRSLIAAPVHSDWGFGAFLGRDRLRFIGSRVRIGESRQVTSIEVDLAARSLAVTGSSDDISGGMLMSPSSDLLICRRNPSAPLELRDARTLRILATLEETGSSPSWGAVFLGNRIVIGGSDEKSSWLNVFSTAGQRLTRIPVGVPGRVRIGGMSAPGELFVTVVHRGESLPPGHRDTPSVLYLADLERSRARKVAEGLNPIIPWFQTSPPAPGSEATKLFVSDDGKLVRFDPVTGERRVLLGSQ